MAASFCGSCLPQTVMRSLLILVSVVCMGRQTREASLNAALYPAVGKRRLAGERRARDLSQGDRQPAVGGIDTP